MYNEQPDWDSINDKKRLEIMVGQAANLANENWCSKKAGDTSLDELFDFYFAFLKKQHDKVFPKPKKLLDHKEIYTKKADGEHIENCNYDDDTI